MNVTSSVPFAKHDIFDEALTVKPSLQTTEYSDPKSTVESEGLTVPFVITGLLHVFTDGILIINVSRYLVLKIKLKAIGSEHKLLTARAGI